MKHLEPRSAILLTVAFILALGLVKSGDWATFGALWIGLATLAGRGALSRICWKALAATPFALSAIPLLFTTPGETLFSLGTLTATRSGAILVTTLLVRAYLGLQASLLVLDSLGSPALLSGLRGLGLPNIIVRVIALMLRYVDVLQEEAERLQRARQSRSAGLTPPAWHRRAATTGMMAGNLFLRSLDRADRVHMAMLCRGYDGSDRTATKPRPWAFVDWAALLFGLSLNILLLVRG